MRRLVAVSKKTSKLSKLMMALAAITIALTSLHLAASAGIASLHRQQASNQLSAISQSAPAGLPAQSTIPASEQTNAAPIQGDGQKPANSVAATPANVPAAHTRQIVISIADRKLALLEGGQLVKTYPIAVGTPGTPSPDGDFVIINHAKDPVYRHGEKEIAPGKNNPLGTRWMGLSLKGYGIHGTNVQSSVGKAASHGCFRMRKQDVEELYTLVQVGDAVTIRRERDAMIAQVFAAPAAPAATVTAQTANAGETQVAAATVTTVETTEQ